MRFDSPTFYDVSAKGPRSQFPRGVPTPSEWHSSRHAVMQCSSLPHSAGRGKAAIPSTISRHRAPHTSTHRPQPVHLSATMTGSHLNFIAVYRPLLQLQSRTHNSCLLHDDCALHPWMRRALEMYYAFLIETLTERAARSEHR